MTYRMIIVLLLFTGCIREVSVPVRITKPMLVVEGLLLTDTTPCKVSLSWSGGFNSYGYMEKNIIDDAQIYLKDDIGDSVLLVYTGEGNYEDQNRGMKALVNHSYKLSINLSDGAQYETIPEKILPVPVDFNVDSIGVAYPYKNDILHGAEVMIRTKDPANEVNYYRWIAHAIIPRQTLGEPCGFYICHQYCFQYYEDHYINVLSDKKINGNEIRFQRALVSPFYWAGRHYAVVKQLSLTQQAYQFWESYKQQTERTGGILDPLPSSLKGNVYNKNDPNDLALGYFEASDAVSLQLVVVPVFTYLDEVTTPAKRYLIPGACHIVLPNATENSPSDWQNIPEFWIKIIYLRP
jgi:hypothetical protein